MLLIKCKCGCFFTMKTDSLTRGACRCQNCGADIPLLSSFTIEELEMELSKVGASVQSFPDNGKITVEFNP